MDDAYPRATSFGVLSGKIIGLDDVHDLRSDDELDCDGAVVIPGMGDSHCHVAWHGLGLTELDLSGVSGLDELYSLVRNAAEALPPGRPVIATGYYHARTGGHPTRAELDRVADGRPVWLKHGSGHLAMVNTEVLRLIGLLDGGTAVPEGGVAERDPHGELTGLLEERAQNLVVAHFTPYPVKTVSTALAAATTAFAANGLTHVTDAGIAGGWIGKTPVEFAAYIHAQQAGELSTRVLAMPAADTLRDLEGHPDDEIDFGLDLGIMSGFGNERLRIGPMKIWVDGGLTSRTANLHESYCDARGHGYYQDSPEVMKNAIMRAHASGWDVAAHAIGDRSIDFVLDTFQEAQQRWPRNGRRHRIEHAGITSLEHVERMAALQITPVPQGRFLYELGDTMADAIGPDRVDMLYRWKSFLNAGLRVPGSSDSPVVNCSPLAGMRSMVDRISSSGRRINPREAVTWSEALRAYTVDAAWMAGQEHLWGRIRNGMSADFVLLSADPTSADDSGSPDIDVLATYLEGSLTYMRGTR